MSAPTGWAGTAEGGRAGAVRIDATLDVAIGGGILSGGVGSAAIGIVKEGAAEGAGPTDHRSDASSA